MTKIHTSSRFDSGFALAGALALLVICAVLGVFFLKMFNLGQEDAARDAMAERAYQAAKAGVDFGLHQTLVNNTCAVAAPSFPGLSDLTVSLSCTRFSTTEAGVAVTVDTWTSLACSAASCPGARTASYVERQLRVSVAR